MSYRKVFSEFINADDDFSILRPGQRINSSNVRAFSTDKGATGRVEVVGGTALIFNTLPAGTNYCLGGAADSAKKRLIFCNYNANGNHGIYCYDKLAATTYTVLLNSQVEGGLNFDKYMRIDANAKIVDDLFIFTDNLNETRKINTEAGIKLNQAGYNTSVQPYATPLKYTTITLIKRPPIYNLTVAKRTDNAYDNNLLNGQAFQFLYRYRYKDNEISALSAHSMLLPINAATDTFNAIDITVPLSEYIDDDIYAIEIAVKYGNNGKKAVVKSWDKDSDAAAMLAHNAGTALSFTFYNDLQGDFIDDIAADSDEDEMPITSKTIELAKDRLHFGSNKVGYTTPVATSLTTTVGELDTGSAGTFQAHWKYMDLSYMVASGQVFQQRYYYVYTPDLLIQNLCYYYAADQSNTPPANVIDAQADLASNTEINLAYAIMDTFPVPQDGIVWRYDNPAPVFTDTGSTLDIIVGTPTAAALRFFKSNSTYKISISFSDRFKRKCGVVKQYSSVTIPVRTWDQSVFSSVIDWALSNTNALAEIPDWAYYYIINVTQNQTTLNFVQAYAVVAAYVTVDNAGAYTFLQEAFTANKYYATAFDLTQLSAAGLGYSYTDGDELILYKSDATHEVIPVIGAYGKYVLTKPVNIGDLSGTQGFVIEIYTPYKRALTDIFYESGNVYAILNPGTADRTYSVLSGRLDGDCYAIQRNNGSSEYFMETMSPNDKYWQDWERDLGWPNAVDSIGQKILRNSIFFSDTYVSGTKDNGLNKVLFTSEVDLDGQNGPIQKLQLANKIQYDGTVLLAICQNETVSCYLGEQEWLDTNGNPYVAKADSVIGTTRPLQGSLGTSHPGSVFEYNGLVFWWDTINGCAVQYSSNGLFPISKNKMVRAAKLFSDKFMSLTEAEIEALGSHPFIIGGFDPYHKEVLFSIPSTEATPPKGFLVDFPTVPYPYDIYDGKGKTLMYTQQFDGWTGSMSFETEMFMRLDNDLYSFKGGALYIHNQTNNPANFYGVQNKASIAFAVNPGGINTYKSIGLESNKTPDWVHLATEDPNLQSSDLPYSGLSDFKNRQGVIEASLMRDRLSPNALGDYDAKEVTGDRLLGKALLVDLEYEFVDDPTPLQLRAVNVECILNQGTMLNK